MITIAPINSVLDRMVTLSRAMDLGLGQDNGDTPQASWIPALDGWETEHAFVVQLDLPGVAAGDVDVSFDRNTLTVRGTRAAALELPKNGTRVFAAERANGTFTRSLRFPQYVQTDGIVAEFKDGVLTVTIPKAEAARARKIPVAPAAPANA